jgi:hypothetical protein
MGIAKIAVAQPLDATADSHLCAVVAQMDKPGIELVASDNLT